jgi:hypothetical protein
MSINSARSPMRLAGQTRPKSGGFPAVDAADLAASVLDRIGMATRLAVLTGERHAAVGCPSPNDCRPCLAERRRQRDEEIRAYRAHQESERREAAAQHQQSAARLAQIASRRPRRLAGLAEAAPACATCEDHQGTLVCKSCGLSRYSDVSILDTINRTGGKR